MELFDYQQQAIDDLRSGIAAGHRCQILYLPTGGGKSICGLDLLAHAERKGSRVAFLTERVALSNQFSRHLDRADIPHGIMQADHPRYAPYERVQVCSQQTLASRGWSKVDLVLVDEAHVQLRRTTEWLERCGCPVIGLSATPFSKGLGNLYTNVVSPTTTDALITSGRLVPIKVYAGKEADMKGARQTDGEWQAGEATSRSIPIIGNITQEWIKHAYQFGDPRRFKTFLFSPTVDYGEMLCEEFRKLGYRFEQISYRDTNRDKRETLLAELNDMDSDLCGIISVDALGRGVDVPNVRCVDMCRPFRKSFTAFVQQLGRGMRSAPGKTECVVLDHSGNCVRFSDDLAYLFAEGCHSLDDGKLTDHVRKEKKAKEKKDIICSCGAVIMPWDTKCAACGKTRKRKLTTTDNVAGELVELDMARKRNKETSQADKRAWMAAFKAYGRVKGYKPGWAAHKYKDRFSEYPRGMDDVRPGNVFPEAAGWIKHCEIKYQHRKRA